MGRRGVEVVLMKRSRVEMGDRKRESDGKVRSVEEARFVWRGDRQRGRRRGKRRR